MGEAARRKRLGFNSREMGDAVLAALNENAGGPVWGLTRGAATPEMFYVADAEAPEVRPGVVTNRMASETPHRVVGIVLIRRGEPWLEAMVFDPCERFRLELYDGLQQNAVRIAEPLMGEETLDHVSIEVAATTFRGERTGPIEMAPGDAQPSGPR